MKKIIVLLDSGFPIRNLLRNSFWETIVQRKDLKILLFSPVVDPYFLEEFGADNVEIRKTIRWKPNVALRLLGSFKRLIWSIAVRSRSFDLKLTLKKGLGYKVFRTIARLVSKRNWVRLHRFISSIERQFIGREAKEVISEYRPDLVFLTTIFARLPSVDLEAFNQGIKTIAFVQSWDNPTTKGPMPFIPDIIAVWNETLTREMMDFHHIDKERIVTVGVPQFDHYLDVGSFQSRQELEVENGVGPGRRILCYTTGTPWTCPYDLELVELIYGCVVGNAFREQCHLVVRTHPTDERDYSRFENLPFLTFHSLGQIKNPLDSWGPTRRDMYRFASLMKHADIVINVASTTTIDAAFFDTPVVNIAFDGETNQDYIRSNRRYYEYCHYENIVKTGGVSLCYDKASFIAAVNEYMVDSSLRSEGRARIVREQCWRPDGLAGKRLADLVLSEVD